MNFDTRWNSFSAPNPILRYTFGASDSHMKWNNIESPIQRVLGRHYRSRLDIDLFPRKLFNSDSRDTALRKLKNRGCGEKERERASRRVVIAATGYRRRRHANSHNVATRNHRRLFIFFSLLFFSPPSQAYRGAAVYAERGTADRASAAATKRRTMIAVRRAEDGERLTRKVGERKRERDKRQDGTGDRTNKREKERVRRDVRA